MRQVTIVKKLFDPTNFKTSFSHQARGGIYQHILVFIPVLVAFCSRSPVAHSDAVLFFNVPDHVEYTNIHFCNRCFVYVSSIKLMF